MLALWLLLSSLVYIWFKKIDAVVPEPYLVSKIQIFQSVLKINGYRMKRFMLDKPRCIFKAAGMSGIRK